MTVVVIVAVVAALVAVVVIVVVLRRRSSDGVETFRRQINALSPEARRQVVDKVQALEEKKPDKDQA